MRKRRTLLALLLVPFFAMIVLLSPPVPAPVIDPGGGGDGGGVACQDSDSTCWHTAQGISGAVKDLILRHWRSGEVVAAGSAGLFYSSDGRVFHAFPQVPAGTLNSLASSYEYQLYVATTAGLYRQDAPPDISPSFNTIQITSNASVSYVAAPIMDAPGPVYANLTAPSSKRGLWRSPDGVNGWVRVLPDVEVRSVVVPIGCDTPSDPQASNRVYVSTNCPTCTSPNLGVLWVSSNAGLAGTWTPLPFPTKLVNDLGVVCTGQFGTTNRWIFAANGTTTGASVWRSVPTDTAMGLNFEPWSNGIPVGGANSFRGNQGLLGDWGVLVGTGTGLYRLSYNLNNAWAPYTVRGLQSPIINRWIPGLSALDVATSAGLSFYWGNPPN